jgi:diguanylate cyclase (GGDEF)-like protein
MRRESLEQLFLHDLLNLAGGLEGAARHLGDPSQDPGQASRQVQDLAREFLDSIRSQRRLMHACCAPPEAGRACPAEVLERVRKVFRGHPVVSGKDLDVAAGLREPCAGDPALLTRALANLVRNALEATPAGGRVRVWHERQGEWQCFLVENPGLMPPEVADRVFERCFTTKGGGEAGRGLGTYGAKLLGEHFLGGEVGFSTTAGQCTRFYIRLPTLRSSTHPDPGPAPVAACVQACAGGPPEGADTLLVVDDSSAGCHQLGDLLSPRYRVLTARNGADGFTLAQEHRPDLILLDVRMPDMDGYAVCRRLKSDSRTREIPVLFLTALGGDGDEMRALEAGAIDFLQKPVNPAVLAARVRNHLELKHLQDRLRNLSLLDALTGIGNRRRFDQYLELEWQRCSRHGQPLSLVMGDVDHFKAYNDGYGHRQGDECLRSVARVFDHALRRPGDLAARYGGEEFVCVLPETDPEGGRIVADQIMEQLEALALPHRFSPNAARVTVSVGVATAPRPLAGRSWHALVEEADRWLYLAKARGRNRIEGPGID